QITFSIVDGGGPWFGVPLRVAVCASPRAWRRASADQSARKQRVRGVRNLRILPKVRDSWSYLYVEHARIDQEDKGICIHDAKGRVHVPCASLSLLMLGPGTSVTHAAIRTLAECGCLVAWCGEQGVRFYAQGMGETRSAARLLRQARLWADEEARLRIVRRMYEMRFGEPLPPALTLRQI